MDIFFWLGLAALIVLVVVLIIILSFRNNVVVKRILNVDSEVRADVLFHLSAPKQNLLATLDLIDFNNYDFISLTDLSIDNQFNYISGISDKDTSLVKFNMKNNNFITSNNQILQGYTEMKHADNFNAVSLKHSFPLSELVYLSGDGISCYLRPYVRLIDQKKYMFVQIKIYLNDATKAYIALSSLLKYITTSYYFDFVIVGNFNVHGHEQVFKDYFSSNDYFICPLYKTLTINNATNGLAAYDGLVVSKNLYKSIDYQVDFSKSDIDRYVLTAVLYYTGIYDVLDNSDYKFKNYVDNLIKLNTNNNYINTTGSYDSAKMPADTSIISIKNITDASDKNYKIYSNELFNKKINTIEIMKN